MSINWDNLEKAETVSDYLDYFADIVKADPKGTYQFLTLELETLYVRDGNDNEGRGVIGETKLNSSIACLEAVRAECIKSLRELGQWPL